jgi:uncharacterized protein YlxW (UPF0749 family)
MDITSWLVGNSVAIVLAIIGGMLWVNTQNGDRKADNSLVRQDLQNHKESHKKLEERVTSHEDKIDQKLAGLDRKIDEKHNILNDKLDELKDLVIERTR